MKLSSIGIKITASNAVMILIILILTGNALYALRSIRNELEDIGLSSQRFEVQKDIESAFISSVGLYRAFIAYGDTKHYDGYQKKMNDTLELQRKLLQMVTEEEKNDIQKLIESTTIYHKGLSTRLKEAVLRQYREESAGNWEAASKAKIETKLIAGEYIPFTNQITEILNRQSARSKEEYEKSNRDAGDYIDKIIINSIIISFIALVVGIILSVALTRRIRNPIVQMVAGANKYAGGDFRESINVASKDEIGELAGALNTMQQNFKDILQKLTNASGILAGSARQLTSQAQQTSAGASEAAATVGQIAATMEDVAQNAREVSLQADSVSGHADKGYRDMELMTGQMLEISSASEQVAGAIDLLNGSVIKIAQFVDIITNIAEQTNLLALNAAIEAARAGDAGRGFAVVAEEVRKLAEQSARSTKEINQLIASIQAQSDQAVQAMASGARKVEQGNNVIQEVELSFKEILKSIKGLGGQVQSVASAAQEVSAGVQNVAATTEEQTAAMQEVSASTEELNKIAEDLHLMVEKFKF